MLINDFFNNVIAKGIELDPREKEYIITEVMKDEYGFQNEFEQKFSIDEKVKNPYFDTMIYNIANENMNKIMIGIDIDTEELKMAKDSGIDTVISYNPFGKALLNSWKTVDIYKFELMQAGVLKTIIFKLVNNLQKKLQLDLLTKNYIKEINKAKQLNLNFLTLHSPVDNYTHDYIKKTLYDCDELNLKEVVAKILQIFEYKISQKNGAHPIIYQYNDQQQKLGKAFIKFNGGVLNNKDIFKYLKEAGITTFITHHLPFSHIEKAHKYEINVILCPRIAGNNLGLNLILNDIFNDKNEEIEIFETAGFLRNKL